MVLAAHSEASYLNKRLSCSRAGSHIFLSENDSLPAFNGLVLTIATIIKFFMYSAAEYDLGALLITAKETNTLRQTLIKMGWSQPPSTIQTDKSTAVGVVKKTIVPRCTKSMAMCFHWLCCCESKGKFRFYSPPGATNWDDYSTKHHLTIYHE